MDIRRRRLQHDRQLLLSLAENSRLIEVDIPCADDDRYVITLRCKGLLWPDNGSAPCVCTNHRFEIYLHVNYPRQPPALRWLSSIFHPNILSASQNGGVCIGHWSPSETLDQLVLRVTEMVQYKQYNVNDPLDPQAAAWTRAHLADLPIDNTPVP